MHLRGVDAVCRRSRSDQKISFELISTRAPSPDFRAPSGVNKEGNFKMSRTDTARHFSMLHVTGQLWRAAIVALTLVTPLHADPDVSVRTFQNFMHDRLDGRTKGYAFALVSPDGIIAKGAGGYAQAPGDGNVRFTVDTVSNLGSVSKLISSTAFMHLLRDKPIADGTVNKQLDTKILPYLPEGLETRFRNKLKDVTFRHVLLHKTGLRGHHGDDEFEPTGERSTLEHAMALGTTSAGDAFAYNNENISMMRFFIPHIAYPRAAARIHNRHRNKSGTAYFAAVRDDYHGLLDQYLKEEFFPKIYSGAQPVCSPVSELPANGYAKRYSSPGASRGTAGDPGYCIPQGGIHMSVRQLARFAKVYGYSRTIVSRGIRKRMEDTNNFTTALVFNSSIGGDHFPEENLTQWMSHGGSFRGYAAAFIRLPHNHYGVALVNSPSAGSHDLKHALYYAYVRATVGLPAPHLSANDRYHFAYREGTYVTRGSSRDHDSSRKFQRGSVMPRSDFDDIFDVSANDRMHFAWYKVNRPAGPQLMVTAGTSGDLDSERELYTSRIAAGYRLDELAFVSSNDEMHFAWYVRDNDIFVGAGSSANLASRRHPKRVTLANGKTARDVIAIVSNDRMHFAFYDDCTYSAGVSNDVRSEYQGRTYDCGDLNR
ncbi:MAG: serine hydrolase domain-containing protein [Pseudomonadota bacterium]